MEDLGQQLQHMLSDPQSLQQLQGLLRSLGQGASEGPPPAAPPAAPLEGLGGAGLTPQALGLVTKLAPLLGQASQEDDATRLLRALRPLLGEARQKKVDEAIKILQLMRLLPLLKESGLFSGLAAGLL